ncbi:MAG: type II toxin-antitoxin system VapC family toxin [Nocardioidaceae bacterium]
MIFLDANIPMYLVGAEHPNKSSARRLVEASVSRQDRLVTDVEVLQEILHRYAALRRPDAIQPAFDVLLGLVDDVFSIDTDDVQSAKQVLLAGSDLSARDTLHIAVMRRHGVDTIMSFDRGFDRSPGLTRLG